jgi:hypothetical protein
VSAVCHHGGAGTTAAGIRAGKPTIIVPFFGDQFFWGSMIWKSGAGAPPIPGKRLNTHELIEAFKIVHHEDTREAAEKLRIAFQHEHGCHVAVESFHRNLPLKKMRSDLEPTFAACYRLEDYDLQISRPVAQVLVTAKMIEESQLTLHSTRAWEQLSDDDHPYLPVHGLMKYGQKAFNSIFVETPNGLRRAASSNNLVAGAREGVECVAKGVGKGIGQATIGCLSFYGDVTDALEHLPNLYDPYSDSDKRKRPQVDNLQSGAKAAGNAVWYGFKDGVTGLVNKPRAGFARDGILGGAAGAAVAIPNMIVKPIAGTLASVTWLSRGVYAEAKNLTKRKDSNGNNRYSVLHLNGHRRSSSGSSTGSNDMSPVAQASYESGLTIEICTKIIAEFEKIQKERNAMKNENGKVIKKESVLFKLIKP